MFSLMLSSEDFPTPMETSEASSPHPHPHPPTMGAPPISRLFPPSQASHSLLPLPPPPPPRPPPHPSPAAVPPSSLAQNQDGTFVAGPGVPPPPTFTAPMPTNPLKRCDDDVQFVSEKPVKRPRLESPAAPTPVSMQAQSMPSAQPAPPLFHGAPALVQGKGEGPVPPTCIPTHTSKAVAGSTPKTGGAETTERGTSLPSLENYTFPMGLPSGLAVCRKDSPQLSPKQTTDTVSPTLSQAPEPQPAISSHEKGQGLSGDTTGLGESGVDTGSGSRENEDIPSAHLNQGGLPEVNSRPIDLGVENSATPQIPPVGNEADLQPTDPAHSLAVPVSEVSPENGLPAYNAFSHPLSVSQDITRQDHQGPTASTATVAPGGLPSSRPPSPATTLPQHNPVVLSSPAPNTSLPNGQDPTTSGPWPCSDNTSPVNTGAKVPSEGGHCLPPSAPKTTVPHRWGPGAPARPHMPARSPSQFQAQPSAQLLARPQPQAHPQSHGHGQVKHSIGHHPSGSGPPKGPCTICAARRQQAALQRAAVLRGGNSAFPHGALPPGTVPAQGHTQAPNGTGYNVVFVPTPMQGQSGPGAQFNPHPNQPGANPSAMGPPSHRYTLQNHPQGMMAPAPPAQPSQPLSTIPNQAPQARPSPRASLQGPPPRSFAHQDPSPGKHIIVDIADTAMEVFPFAAVAARHNVPADKVRNIFEAVVGVPLLRVPADKRRAGRLGQERVKKYLIAKRGLERQRATGGMEGAQVLASEVAAAMGPEVPREWAQAQAQGQGVRGPW